MVGGGIQKCARAPSTISTTIQSSGITAGATGVGQDRWHSSPVAWPLAQQDCGMTAVATGVGQDRCCNRSRAGLLAQLSCGMPAGATGVGQDRWHNRTVAGQLVPQDCYQTVGLAVLLQSFSDTGLWQSCCTIGCVYPEKMGLIGSMVL